MASGDPLKSGSGSAQNPVDAAYVQALASMWGLSSADANKMNNLYNQQNAVFNNPNLSYNDKVSALTSLSQQIDALPINDPTGINWAATRGPGVNAGIDLYNKLDAAKAGIVDTPSGVITSDPSFGYDYEEVTPGDNGAGIIQNNVADTPPDNNKYVATTGDQTIIDNQPIDTTGGVTGDYYSNLINQMSGENDQQTAATDQYAKNLGSTLTDATVDNGPPPGAVQTEFPGVWLNPDGSFWTAPVNVTISQGADEESSVSNKGQTEGSVNATQDVSPQTWQNLNLQNWQSSLTLDDVAKAIDSSSTGVPVPANSGMAAVEDGARVAASRGLLQQYFDSNPSYIAAVGNDIMPQLQAIDKTARTNIATGGATLSNPASTQTSTAANAQQAATNSSQTATTPTTVSTNVSPTNYSGVIGNLGVTDPNSQAAVNNAAISTLQGPVVGTLIGSTSGTTGGMTGGATGGTTGGVTGGAIAGVPGGMTSGVTGGVTGGVPGGVTGGVSGGLPGGVVGGVTGGIPGGVVGGVIGGVPGGVVGGVTGGVPGGVVGGTAGGVLGGVSGGVSGGVTGGVTGGITGNNISGDTGGGTTTEKLWSDVSPGITTPINIDKEPTTTTTKVSPTTTTTTPTTGSPAYKRKYLGASSDPYNYGFGSERQYYGWVPAAADGGLFNADQYFADGGLVQPLSPPSTPVVPAQPTMAFTDGAGPIGSIAQPPGLSPDQTVGFDASNASPMAPSSAAAAPSFQSGLGALAMPSTNASPVLSQIAQNPNVGYALGSSPLSKLTRS
jgi:hypothetical protein